MIFDGAGGGGIDRSKPDIMFAALQILLDTEPDMIFVKDMDLFYVAATKSFAVDMMKKASVSEVLGRSDRELLGEEIARRYTADDRKLLDGGENLLDYVEPITEKNGKARYSSTSKYILTDEKGEKIGLLGISRDISDEIRLQQRYQREVEYLFTLPADTYTALYVDLTDWRIIGQRRQTLNQHTIPLFATLESFLHYIQAFPSDKQCEAYRFYQNFDQRHMLDLHSRGTGNLSLEYPFAAKNGEIRWMHDEMKFMSDPNNGHQCLMIIARDISDTKNAK